MNRDGVESVGASAESRAVSQTPSTPRARREVLAPPHIDVTQKAFAATTLPDAEGSATLPDATGSRVSIASKTRKPTPVESSFQAAIEAALAELPSLLTPEEAATFLRRSTRTLRRLEALGMLRVIRVAGGRPLIAREELKRLLLESAA